MSAMGDFVAAAKKLWPARLFGEGAFSSRLLLLGLLGVALLAFGSLYDAAPAKPRQAAPPAPAKTAAVPRSYEEALEAKLANLLSQVRGAAWWP